MNVNSVYSCNMKSNVPTLQRCLSVVHAAQTSSLVMFWCLCRVLHELFYYSCTTCIDFSRNLETDTLLQHTVDCKYVNVKE